MAEFLLELYSEEVPPQLQINARNELKQILEKSIEEEGLKYKAFQDFLWNPYFRTFDFFR